MHNKLLYAFRMMATVRSLMDSDSELKKKVKEMRKMARKGVLEGGSSLTAVGQLIKHIIGSN